MPTASRGYARAAWSSSATTSTAAPESRGVVERLLADPLPGFATVRLMGNHEEAMLAFLDGDSDGLDWLSFGGLETLLSYGVPLRSLPDTAERGEALRGALAEAVPQRHVAFYSRLRPAPHGRRLRLRPCRRAAGHRLEKQTPTDLLWIRDDFLRARIPLPGPGGGAWPYDLRPAAEPRPPHQHRHRRLRQRPADLPGAARQRAAVPLDRRRRRGLRGFLRACEI